jgi:DNA-binding IclR family transcriptional regulator
MSEVHDVQALSDVDIHVYEAVASQAVGSGGATLDGLVRASGLAEEELRKSLASLIAHGYVVPRGDRYGLGPHTFEVEY